MTEPADRPQPVVNASRLGGLISAVFVAVGGAVLTITQGITAKNLSAVGLSIDAAVTAVVALVVYVVAVIHGKAAAAEVTPLTDPRDDRGRQLLPVGKHAAEPSDETAAGLAYIGSRYTVTAPSSWPPEVQEAFDAWRQHPRSVPKTQALIAAVDGWKGAK